MLETKRCSVVVPREMPLPVLGRKLDIIIDQFSNFNLKNWLRLKVECKLREASTKSCKRQGVR